MTETTISLMPDLDAENEAICHEMRDAWYLCRPTPPNNQQILATRFFGDLGIVVEVSKYREESQWKYQVISAAYYQHRTGDEFLAIKGWCRIFDDPDTEINEGNAIQFMNDVAGGLINPRHYLGSKLLPFSYIYSRTDTTEETSDDTPTD